MFKNFLILVLLSSCTLFASTDTPIFLQQLSAAFEKIKIANDHLKTGIEQLDSINKINQTMNSLEKLAFETGEKLYDPTKDIMALKNQITSIQNNAQRIAKRVEDANIYDRFFTSNWDCKLEFSSTIEEKKHNEAVKEIAEKTGLSIPTIERQRCVERDLNGKNQKAINDKFDKEITEAIKKKDFNEAKILIQKKANRNNNEYKKQRSNNIGYYTKVSGQYELLNKDLINNSINAEIIEIKLKEWSKDLDTLKSDLESSNNLGAKINITNSLLRQLVEITIEHYKQFLAYNNSANLFFKTIESEKKQNSENATINYELTDLEKEFINKYKPKYNKLGIPIF